MKLPTDKKLITDTKTGRTIIVPRENPKLNTSAKIAKRKSKKQKPVRRTV